MVLRSDGPASPYGEGGIDLACLTPGILAVLSTLRRHPTMQTLIVALTISMGTVGCRHRACGGHASRGACYGGYSGGYYGGGYSGGGGYYGGHAAYGGGYGSGQYASGYGYGSGG